MDVEKIESDIKGKLENVFDIRNIYEIFGSLIGALKEQNSEIKRLSSVAKNIESIQDKVSSMDKAIHIIEYNIQGFETIVEDDSAGIDEQPTPSTPSRIIRKRTTRRDNNSVPRSDSQDSEVPPPPPQEHKTNEEATVDNVVELVNEDNVSSPIPADAPPESSATNEMTTEEQNERATTSIEHSYTAPMDSSEGETFPVNPEEAKQAQVDITSEHAADVLKEKTEEEDDRDEKVAEAVETVHEPSEEVEQGEEGGPGGESEKEEQENVDELFLPAMGAAQWSNERREQWRIKKRRIMRKVHFYIKSMIALKKSYAGVAKSKLDPKLSVNNRIKTLEDNLIALSDLVNVHRRALEAVPARIKAAIPADLKTQLQKINANISRIDKNVAALSLNPNAATIAEPSSAASLTAVIPAPSAPITSLTPQLSPRPVPSQRGGGTGRLESFAEPVSEAQPPAPAPAAFELPPNVVLLDADGNVPSKVLHALRKQLQEFDKAEAATPVNEPTSIKSEPAERSIVVGGNRRNSRNAVSHLAKFQTSRDAEEVVQRPDSSDMSAYMKREDVETCARRVFDDMAMQYVSKEELMTMVNNKTAVSGSYNPYPFADRLKGLIAGELKALTENYVTKDDLAAALKGLQTTISLEMRRNEKQEHEQIMILSSDIKERLDGLEIESKQLKTQVDQLQHPHAASSHATPRKHELLSAQPSSSNLFRAQSKREGRMTSVGEGSSASKAELLKLSEALKKASGEQEAVVHKLSQSVDNVMGMISVRVTEEQVEKMLHNLEENMKQQVSTTVTTLSMALNNVLYAVKNKAGRDEVNTIVTSKLSEVQQSLHSKDSVGDDSEAPAGSVKCISCGTFTTKVLPLDSPSGSIGVVPDTRGDYEQMVTVLQRNAGLKPLNRHHNAVMPKPATAGSRVRSQEPLYRRAKIANQLREIPKIPLVTMSHSASSPSQLYVLDDSFDDSSAGGEAPASLDSFITTIPNAESLKLPRVK